MSSTSTTEDVRLYCGLSKAQYERLAAVCDPETLPELFDAFLADIRAKVEIEFTAPAHMLGKTPVLSTVQVARALGVGEFHLSNLRDRGKLNSSKFGRRAVYSKADLDAFLDQQKIKERRSALAAAFVQYAATQTRELLPV